MAFLNYPGLSHFLDKIKTIFVYSSQGLGNAGKYLKVNAQGVVEPTQLSPATTEVAGLMSATDKTKLDGIASGAEVNQNAFSNIAVGSTTISADGKTDTLTLAAGSNITLTPDATNDKITIAATDTTYSAATQSAAGLMSSTDKTKLDGVATGATAVNVYDGLDSTSTTNALSARQGKALNDRLSTENLGTISSDDSCKSALLSCANSLNEHDSKKICFETSSYLSEIYSTPGRFDGTLTVHYKRNGSLSFGVILQSPNYGLYTVRYASYKPTQWYFEDYLSWEQAGALVSGDFGEIIISGIGVDSNGVPFFETIDGDRIRLKTI